MLKKRKKEVTLDHVSLHTTKGHSCSLLISNIFCYPLFPSLPFAFFTTPETLFSFFSTENTACFLFVSHAKGESFSLRRLPTPDPNFLLLFLVLHFLTIYVMRMTPPCFYRISGRSVNFVCLGEVRKV